MRYYFLITGVLFVLYYLILVWHSRKLRSTFAVFWLFTGGAHLIIGCAPFPVWVYTLLKWICLFCWVVVFLIEIRIIRAMFAKCGEELDWLIVLGAQVRGTYITNSLRRRRLSGTATAKQEAGRKPGLITNATWNFAGPRSRILQPKVLRSSQGTPGTTAATQLFAAAIMRRRKNWPFRSVRCAGKPGSKCPKT